jgi:proteasome accessory factor A
LERRIFGTESEYGLAFSSGTPSEIRVLEGESLLNRMKTLTPWLLTSLKSSDYPSAGEFLGNGGRFYIDRGGHPEYATPECCTVSDLVAHEKAGDRIVQELTDAAGALLAQEGRPGKLEIFKNNVDSFGTTYGGHENYLVTPKVTADVESLVPFLVTRQIFAGAGKVGRSDANGDFSYQLTQRADFIDRVFSDRTSQVRGIINLRKREIPHPDQNRRLHLIFGDSNMCEYALALKVGCTDLVLALVEEGGLGGMPAMTSPVDSLKAISRSPKAGIALEGRKGTFTALDVQRMYMEKALQFFSSRTETPERRHMLELWGHTLDGLEKLKLSEETLHLEDDPAELRRRLDWVLKLWLVERIRSRKRPAADDRGMLALDLRYHDLNPGTGVQIRCESLGLVDRLCDDATVSAATKEPPCDTRAWLRGTVIRSAAGRNLEVRVENWEQVKISAYHQRSGDSQHPFSRHRRISKRVEIKLEDPFLADRESLLERVSAILDIADPQQMLPIEE